MKTLASRPSKECFLKNTSIHDRTRIQALLTFLLESIACLLGNEEIDEPQENGSSTEK